MFIETKSQVIIKQKIKQVIGRLEWQVLIEEKRNVIFDKWHHRFLSALSHESENKEVCSYCTARGVGRAAEPPPTLLEKIRAPPSMSGKLARCSSHRRRATKTTEILSGRRGTEKLGNSQSPPRRTTSVYISMHSPIYKWISSWCSQISSFLCNRECKKRNMSAWNSKSNNICQFI